MIDWLSELVATPVKEYLQFEAALSFLGALAARRRPRPARHQRLRPLEMRVAQLGAGLQRRAEDTGCRGCSCSRASTSAACSGRARLGRSCSSRTSRRGGLDGLELWRKFGDGTVPIGRRLDARRPTARPTADGPTERPHRPAHPPAIHQRRGTLHDPHHRRARPDQAVRRDPRPSTGSTSTAEPARWSPLLGPNGAGKTTFVRTVATLMRPDGGTLHVAGIDVVRHSRDRCGALIGLAGQYAAVEEAMTGRENLEMIARLFGQGRRQAAAPSADAVLDQLGLGDAADRLVRTYSGGMRRRLDLGASLVGAPRLLLLDEPTTGLDPRSRIELWDAIRALVDGGTDVLLTTQYLDEADQLAGRIVIIDHGRVIADGTPAELKAPGRPRRHRDARARSADRDGGRRGRPAWRRRRTTPSSTRPPGGCRSPSRTAAASWSWPMRAARRGRRGGRATSPCADPPSTRCSWP